MNISDIPSLYKNLTRTAEVVSVLSKYGLAEWLHRLNIDLSLLPIPHRQEIRDLSKKTLGERIRLTLEELGPSFIKLGQILSTRADLVPPEVLEELKKLQSGTSKDGFEYVKQLLNKELGEEKLSRFKTFEYEAFASASIGQVHRAVLNDDTEVVVKVRHKGIEKVISKDLEILAALATLANKSKELKVYDPEGMVQEFSTTLRHELDFLREQRNLQHFKRNFADVPDLKIPETYPELCTGKVLTMETLQGVRLADCGDGTLDDDTRKALAKRGAEVFLDMVFDYGLFHADPHPGNFIIIEKRIIGLIDFGMVGYLDENLREEIENMLLAILHNDPDLLSSIILRLGDVPFDIDKSKMQRDLREFVSFYGTMAISDLPLAKVLEDLLAIIRKYHIALPTQAAMLIKVLIMLEGTSHLLNPSFSMMEILQPLQQKILRRRLSPERNLKRLRRVQDQVEHALSIVPGQLVEIVDKVQKGNLKVGLNHSGMASSVNRLVLGLIASALFLGGSLMLSIKVHPLLFKTPWYGFQDISLLGAIVIFFSFSLIFRLFLAIRKSDKL